MRARRGSPLGLQNDVSRAERRANRSVPANSPDGDRRFLSLGYEGADLWSHRHGGQGVLRECLLDPDIDIVQAVGRSPTGVKHLKLREIVRPDLFHYAEIEDDLRGFDVCFFCLGVSSAGMSEPEYQRLTYSLTKAPEQTLSRLNCDMTFVYVSGAGTDSSEKGRSMWARIKAGPKI